MYEIFTLRKPFYQKNDREMRRIRRGEVGRYSSIVEWWKKMELDDTALVKEILREDIRKIRYDK